MTSRCTIRRKGGATPNTDGYEVGDWADIHIDLPFRLGGSERGGSGYRTARIADTEVQVAVRVAHLPVTTTDLGDGDLIEVTAGENAGAVLQIVEASWQDQATARRVPVFEVQRPEGWS